MKNISANYIKVCYNVWELIQMAKKLIKTRLKNSEETINLEVNAIINDNKIVYKDKDVTNTVIIDDNSVDIIRKNDEYQLSMKFSKNSSQCTYKLLKLDRILNMDIETINLDIKDCFSSLLFIVHSFSKTSLYI